MLHIALITYDISPYRGSESSVSWNFVTKMSSLVRLTVVYGRGHEDVSKYLSENTVNNVEWINIPTVPTRYSGMLGHLDYMRNYSRWQKKAKEILEARVKAGEIDLIHYLNPIGFKEPGYCWQIENVPYVWGPIGCVENRPFRLYRAYSMKGKSTALTRRIAHNALFLLMPRLRKALKNTDQVFAATPTGIRLLKKAHHCNAIYLPENGILRMETDSPITYDSAKPLQLIWVGRVNDEDKAIVILLDALLKTTNRNWHLHIIGKGDLPQKLRRRITGIETSLTFYGQIPRSQVQELFMKSHIHIISSMGENNPTIIWEAMAKGIPTMTLDHCGMAGVVCDKCGIKIPIESYKKVTSRMATEIDRLIAEPERVRKLSEGVLECSKNFLWGNRINLFLDTYTRLIDQYASGSSK